MEGLKQKIVSKKYRSIWLYGLSLATLLFLLKWVELKFVIYDNALDIYAGIIATLFTALGIWLALKLSKPKVETIILEKTIYLEPVSQFIINQKALEETGISTRELEVLEWMAKGESNKAIAEKLFVSLNTIKSHCSRIFEKLEVSSRMQAIEKARKMGILA
jgi:DNA-binding CsgD family transcriptional regulator